ncbi:MAG: DegV family protein [Acholeplasmataceae bacterium]|nr:DegV family protein [Acholeplasmataceae bacterium]
MIFVTDSCSDLTNEFVKAMDLKIVPLSVEIEGKSYFHYPDERELKIKDFYQMLRDKKIAKTSLVNVGTFLDFFEPYAKSGEEIIYIAFSSALSGTYQSSVVAVEELKEKYPDSNIHLVDTLAASMGQGLLIWYADQMRKKGSSILEIKDWLNSNKLNLCHLFTVDDLGTLKRGGRLSDTQAFLGTLLKVKPILHVSNEGKLVPLKKARGREFSLESMVELMKDKITSPEKQTIFISHGDCLEEAKKVGKLIQEKYKVKDIFYNTIGPVIGAHSGPGTIAVFFMGNQR